MNPKHVLRFLLVLVLLAGFSLRLRGSRFGFPLFVNGDEASNVKTVTNMIQGRDFNPHCFSYPSLFFYQQGLVYLAGFQITRFFGKAQKFSDIPPLSLFHWGRLFTIFLSVGTVLFVYLAAWQLFGRESMALAATLFLAFALLSVENSFLITPDAPMSFWVAFSFLFSVMIYRGKRHLGFYLANGILIGLATGNKYTAFLCVIPFLYAHFAVASPRENLKILWGTGAVVLTFLLTTPYAILDYSTFSAWLSYQASHYSQNHPGAESAGFSYLFYLKTLAAKYGLLPLILSCVGIFLLGWADIKKAFLITIFPLLFFLFVGRYRVHFDRNILSLLPFLALMAGFALVRLSQLIFSGRWHVYMKYLLLLSLMLLTGAGIFSQARASVEHVRRITLPDTRYLAGFWLLEHIPSQALVGREHYTPPLVTAKFQLAYLGYFGLVRNNLNYFDYLIASSFDYSRFTENPRQYPGEAQKYQEIFAKCKLIKEFRPDEITTTGPVIRVYQRPGEVELTPLTNQVNFQYLSTMPKVSP